MKFKAIIKYALTTVSIIIILICLLIYFIVDDSKKRLSLELANPTERLYTIPKNYSQLLKADNKLRFLMTTYSKYRNPVSGFYYDEDYFLDVYKLGKADTISIKNTFDEFSTVGENLGEEYNSNANSEKTLFTMGTKVGRPDSLKRIYLNIEGKNTRVIKKDNYMAYYSSNFNSISIRYDEKADKEFLGNIKGDIYNLFLPLELILVKKPDGIYLIVLTVLDKSTKIKEGMLLSLLNSQNIKE